MTRDQLRARQQPLKQLYRDQPSTGVIPLAAEGELGEALTCRVRTHGTASDEPGETMAGLHPATGGDGQTACSGEMLLEAVVACAGVTLQAVATSMGVDVRGGRLRAVATWDARGTLAVDRSAPVGMTGLRLHADLDTDADDQTLDQLLHLTERYCVVLQTITGHLDTAASWSRRPVSAESA
jgi:uncharacterized OsmC-like protein